MRVVSPLVISAGIVAEVAHMLRVTVFDVVLAAATEAGVRGSLTMVYLNAVAGGPLPSFLESYCVAQMN